MVALNPIPDRRQIVMNKEEGWEYNNTRRKITIQFIPIGLFTMFQTLKYYNTRG